MGAGAGLDPRKWGVQNRPTPRAVGLLVRGVLVASAACGALTGLAVLEIATRKWPAGVVGSSPLGEVVMECGR